MKRSHAWILLYALALLADVIGLLGDIDVLHQYGKPLLMPLLMWGLLLYRQEMKGRPWMLVLAGLFLSWAGDIFLLFEAKGPMFFIGGLASFLLAHVCYIIYFLRCEASYARAWGQFRLWLILALSYSAGLVALLFPKLGELLIPVMAYAAVLTLMLISSIAVIGSAAPQASRFLVIGAICFVVSDSCLAFNKFHTPFPLAGVIIMMTYGVAQWLITTGTILNTKS